MQPIRRVKGRRRPVELWQLEPRSQVEPPFESDQEDSGRKRQIPDADGGL
jgi:hypothetical protein